MIDLSIPWRPLVWVLGGPNWLDYARSVGETYGDVTGPGQSRAPGSVRQTASSCPLPFTPDVEPAADVRFGASCTRTETLLDLGEGVIVTQPGLSNSSGR